MSEPRNFTEEMAEQLARFNREREALLGGKPPVPGERMPLPHTGVGGDVAEEAGAQHDPCQPL